MSHGFSGQVTFMVIPLFPCDLSEFDLRACSSFWGPCEHVGGRRGAEGCQSTLPSGFQYRNSNWTDLGVGVGEAFEKSGFAL